VKGDTLRFHVLAADYDGTLAHHGVVSNDTLKSLTLFRESGRRLVLVTGRRLEPLLELFPAANLFERIVAENGAVIFNPATGKEALLGELPPAEFLEDLRSHGVQPIEYGKCIVATWTPHEHAVLEAIRRHALEIQIIFNKDAVMLLPSGINKAVGLRAALDDLGMSPWNTVAVGDAENDEAMLRFCSGSAAVENALDAVKKMASIVLTKSRGEGVQELIEMILADDLDHLRFRPIESLQLGKTLQGTPFVIPAHGESILVTGGPGGGKSRFALSVLERATALGQQCCIVDPEGDYQRIDNSIHLGNAKRAPSIAEVVGALEQPQDHCVVSFFGVEKPERPTYFDSLHHALADLRNRTGRPHWIIVDEAHYAAPKGWHPAETWTRSQLQGTMFVTAYHDAISETVLRNVDWIISIANDPRDAIAQCCDLMGEPLPEFQPPEDLQEHRALAWRRGDKTPRWFIRLLPESERQRHQHSYMEGDMDLDLQFVFRGPESKLQLATPNLRQFINIGKGVDDNTWNYHLRRHDYSRWFLNVIKDEELAAQVEYVERDEAMDAEQSRQKIFDTIYKRFGIDAELENTNE
jgi:hydroxymethylpyrimidine pyrophosphatase-like HAD family hydrolase